MIQSCENGSQGFDKLGFPVKCGKRPTRLKRSSSSVQNRALGTRAVSVTDYKDDKDGEYTGADNVNSWRNQSGFQSKDAAVTGVTRGDECVGFGGDTLFAFARVAKCAMSI